MKKMYFLTVFLIALITAGFLLFSTDPNGVNQRFLSSFGIEAEPNTLSAEEIVIPAEFDEVYENYNLLQLECGLDLSPYRGRRAVRYSYRVLNFPEAGGKVFADVICIGRKPVAGDIMSPAADGFMKPLNFIGTLGSLEKRDNPVPDAG